MPKRKKIAAIITEYRPLSHADVIVTKFMKGFPTDDRLIQPRVGSETDTNLWTFLTA